MPVLNATNFGDISLFSLLQKALKSNQDVKQTGFNCEQRRPVFRQVGGRLPCLGLSCQKRWGDAEINLTDMLNMPAVCAGLLTIVSTVCMCVCVKVNA